MPTPRALLLLPLALLHCSALLLPATPAWAFRCNSNVIDAGMQLPEVLNKCGQPTERSTRVELRIERVRGTDAKNNSVEFERVVQVNVDDWTYNFGPHQFMQRLVFENGQLRRVSDLGLGR